MGLIDSIPVPVFESQAISSGLVLPTRKKKLEKLKPEEYDGHVENKVLRGLIYANNVSLIAIWILSLLILTVPGMLILFCAISGLVAVFWNLTEPRSIESRDNLFLLLPFLILTYSVIVSIVGVIVLLLFFYGLI